jgi:hypothetical protein
MSSESKLVVELWDYFRDMMPSGKRQEAANHLLRLFQEYGVQFDQHDIEGEDEFLDEAILHLDDDEHHDDADYNGHDDRD